MENSKYSSARVAGREHIPIYPHNFIALRIVQLVLAVIVIGLAAYGVAGLAFDGDIFIMVVGLMTLIVTIYYLVAEFSSPAAYNYWAVLALDIFLVIMWLASFALLASDVSLIYSYGGSSSYYYYKRSDVAKRSAVIDPSAWAACLAACSALGGVEFALFAGSLATHSVMLHRHRKAGLHSTPGAAQTTPAASTEFKQQATATATPVQQYAVPQQQAYAVPAANYPQQQYQQA